jgi:hypothetical protein
MATAPIGQDRFIPLVQKLSTARAFGFRGIRQPPSTSCFARHRLMAAAGSLAITSAPGVIPGGRNHITIIFATVH